jgi:DNA invertase Pin-like site-specific DNA recombinase
MILGYARVSSSEQDTTLQLDAFSRSGVDRVFQEHRPGAGVHRPELERVLEQLRAGDVVVVYKIDRLARSLSDLLQLLARIEAHGAAFRSLTEPIDTSTPAGRMLMQLLGAFAEFERGMIRERSIAGQRAAMDRGKHCGRPASLTIAEGARAAELIGNGQATLSGLARLHGVHLSSVKRAIKRAREVGKKKPAQGGLGMHMQNAAGMAA